MNSLSLALAFGRRSKKEVGDSFQTMDDGSVSVVSSAKRKSPVHQRHQLEASELPLSPSKLLKQKLASPFGRSSHGRRKGAPEKMDRRDLPERLPLESSENAHDRSATKTPSKSRRAKSLPRPMKMKKIKKKKKIKKNSSMDTDTTEECDPSDHQLDTSANCSSHVSAAASNRPKLLAAPSRTDVVAAPESPTSLLEDSFRVEELDDSETDDARSASAPNLTTAGLGIATESLLTLTPKVRRSHSHDLDASLTRLSKAFGRDDKGSKMESYFMKARQDRRRGRSSRSDESIVSHSVRGGTSHKHTLPAADDTKSVLIADLFKSPLATPGKKKMDHPARSPRTGNNSNVVESPLFLSQRSGRRTDTVAAPKTPTPSTPRGRGMLTPRSPESSPSSRDPSVERGTKLQPQLPSGKGSSSPRSVKEHQLRYDTLETGSPRKSPRDGPISKGSIRRSEKKKFPSPMVDSPLSLDPAKKSISRVELLKQEMEEEVRTIRKKRSTKHEVESPGRKVKSSSSVAVDEHLRNLSHRKSPRGRKEKNDVSSSSPILGCDLSSVLDTKSARDKPKHVSGSRSVAHHDLSQRKRGTSRTRSSSVTPKKASSRDRTTCSPTKKTGGSRHHSGDAAFTVINNVTSTPKKQVSRAQSSLDFAQRSHAIPRTPKKSIGRAHSSDEVSFVSPKKSPRASSPKRSLKKRDEHEVACRAKSARPYKNSLDRLGCNNNISPQKSKSQRSVADTEEEDDFEEEDIIAIAPVKGRKVTKTLASDSSSVVVPQLQLPGIDVSSHGKMSVQYEDVRSVMISCEDY